MECPGCGVTVHPKAWFCQVCGHQVKSSEEIQSAVEALDDGADLLDHDTVSHDATSGDALILGELSADFDLSSDNVEVMETAIPDGEGGSSSYVVYAESTATKQISPDAVPRMIDGVSHRHLSSLQSRILEHVDGVASVIEIRAAGQIDKKLMLVEMLALLDRGVITFEAEPPLLDASLLEVVPEAKAPPQPAIPRESTAKLKEKALHLLGVAERDRGAGNVEAARRNAEVSAMLDPDVPGFDVFLASLDAVASMTKPEAKSPRAQRLFEQAGAAERSGQVDEAVALLERALSVSREAMIFNRLGVILATRKRDFERARAMLEEATRLAPENPAYVHNLSKVLGVSSQQTGKEAKRPSLWSRILKRR